MNAVMPFLRPVDSATEFFFHYVCRFTARYSWSDYQYRSMIPFIIHVTISISLKFSLFIHHLFHWFRVAFSNNSYRITVCLWMSLTIILWQNRFFSHFKFHRLSLFDTLVFFFFSPRQNLCDFDFSFSIHKVPKWIWTHAAETTIYAPLKSVPTKPNII